MNDRCDELNLLLHSFESSSLLRSHGRSSISPARVDPRLGRLFETP